VAILFDQVHQHFYFIVKVFQVNIVVEKNLKGSLALV